MSDQDLLASQTNSKEAKEALEKKNETALKNLRMKKAELRGALIKKYRRPITDRMLNILEF